jgi:hypothetical protein
VNNQAIKSVPKKNLFNKYTATSGYFVNSGTGAVAASSLGQSYSDYIPVTGSTYYVATNVRTAPGSSGSIGLAWYDQSKSFISNGVSYINGGSLTSFLTPSTARFIRFTFMGSEIDSVQLEKGIDATPYEAFQTVNKPSKRKEIAFEQVWNTVPYYYQYMKVNGVYADYMNVTSLTTDPGLHMFNLGSFDPNVYRYIEIKYRLPAGVSNGLEIYFLNAATIIPIAGQRVAVGSVPATGQWETIKVDMWESPKWKESFITGWRYDWGTQTNVTMDLAYIRLVRDSKVNNIAKR